MSDSDAQIHRFFERYRTALSNGDVSTIADCWGMPAFVSSDWGFQPVSDPGEVKAFFEQAIGTYRAQGMETARAKVERIERLSRHLVSVDVRWSNLNEGGAEPATERLRYVLGDHDGAGLRIHVLVIRTEDS